MCLGTIVPSLALGLFRTYKVEGCWLLIISILSFFPISLALVRITVCLVSVGHDLTMSFSSQCAMTQDTLFWSKWLIPLPSSFFFFLPRALCFQDSRNACSSSWTWSVSLSGDCIFMALLVLEAWLRKLNSKSKLLLRCHLASLKPHRWLG